MINSNDWFFNIHFGILFCYALDCILLIVMPKFAIYSENDCVDIARWCFQRVDGSG